MGLYIWQNAFNHICMNQHSICTVKINKWKATTKNESPDGLNSILCQICPGKYGRLFQINRILTSQSRHECYANSLISGTWWSASFTLLEIRLDYASLPACANPTDREHPYLIFSLSSLASAPCWPNSTGSQRVRKPFDTDDPPRAQGSIQEDREDEHRCPEM